MELANAQVLVTGADGFIGSHLVERLVVEGCRVRAFVLYNSFNSWGWLDTIPQDVREQIDVVAGDVRDFASVRGAMEGVEAVFHLAALIAIPYSYRSPESYVATNVSGTLNVLQAARDSGCARVAVTSTSEVYGTARYVPIDESHPLQAQSPYSATKIAADRLAESFHKSFGLPVVTVRPFNTYGPRQSMRAVIPTVIGQMLAGAAEIHVGSLTPTRDFVYVADTVEGFVEIVKADACIGEEVNIATQQEISIGRLIEVLAERTGSSARIVTEEQRLRPEASEVFQLLGANDKITKLTEWRPRVAIEEGLDRTIEWVGANLSAYKHAVYNV